MKKWIAVLLALLMGLAFSACEKTEENTEDHPYAEYDLTKYVTFEEYEDVKVEIPDVEISEGQIDTRIEEILDASSMFVTSTDSIAENGDKAVISYEGKLADGTTDERLNGNNFEFTLGEGRMIAGFEEAIVGMKTGENKRIELRFPDPYEINAELSGKKATFDVTLEALLKKTPVEYNKDFIKEHSGGKAKNEEEFRTYISEILYAEVLDDLVSDIQTDMYTQIKERAKVSGYIDTEVEKEAKSLEDMYKQYAKTQGYEWEEFLEKFFDYSEEEFKSEAQKYGEGVVEEKMIIYALADRENVKLSLDRYNQELEKVLMQYGCPDEETFAYMYGMSLEQYAEQYGLKINLLLDITLEKIYDRLSKNN